MIFTPRTWTGRCSPNSPVCRRLATALEDRFRAEGRPGARLAVLEGNTRAMSFWTSLGYEVIDHRRDQGMGRECAVMQKGF
ncbi:hypothetical protein SRB5_32150 [Streptomyces sp. RB5]|uniref:N-acetyltransferase domain-containing protein n=1 Tax=Streptomyces smaragdinus TaxID=2585196 RepID=A0A7K0CHW7_9ACTN|nr:hypothetical protein [Streptomyces smaragdinus]MQY13075.1 hypothetical protein [Streptomyces smaragdinus]